MKSFLIFLSLVFLTAIATYALAVPVNDDSEEQDIRAFRVRRDISGVFDSITNGFEGLMEGAKKVSDSVFTAFNAIFSTDNKNALTTGFSKFGHSMRNAFDNMFGSNGSKVKEGVKKVGDKIKSVWTGKADHGTSGRSNKNEPVPSPPSPANDKSAPPEGQVPQEETT